MRILINLTLYAAILALTGCGDDQAGQAVQQEKAVQMDEAAMQEHVAIEAHKAMQEHAAVQKHIAAVKPQWADLENNVYHYPE
jgi:uncharacterized protein YcfL